MPLRWRASDPPPRSREKLDVCSPSTPRSSCTRPRVGRLDRPGDRGCRCGRTRADCCAGPGCARPGLSPRDPSHVVAAGHQSRGCDCLHRCRRTVWDRPHRATLDDDGERQDRSPLVRVAVRGAGGTARCPGQRPHRSGRRGSPADRRLAGDAGRGPGDARRGLRERDGRASDLRAQAAWSARRASASVAERVAHDRDRDDEEVRAVQDHHPPPQARRLPRGVLRRSRSRRRSICASPLVVPRALAGRNAA